MSERPYPEGIAWDEAWRQRRRADRLEAALKKISDGRGMIPDKSTIYMSGRVPEVPKHFNMYDMREIAATALENQYDND